MRNSDPGGDGIWGTADDDYGDLHLQAGSPCIDAGDNAISWRLAAFDLDGRYRILNCRVDMGAYEFARHELLPEEAPTLCHVITRITGGELDLHLPREGGSESRSGTLSKVILLFSEPVQAVDGVPDATELSLSGATLGSVTTTGPEMALTVSGVSDESCLGITVAGLADLTGNLLAGDSGAHIRVLAGDGNMSGNITLADALLAKSKIGQPVTLYPHLDYNLSGGISLADALYAKGRIGKQALCP